MATAEAAEAALQGLTAKRQGGAERLRRAPHAIREKELGAIIRWAKGQKDEALALAKDAADVEVTMAAPSGPPEPIKPAFELYGELLLGGRPGQGGGAAFEQALLRTPNRTPSVKGLEKATAAAEQTSRAR